MEAKVQVQHIGPFSAAHFKTKTVRSTKRSKRNATGPGETQTEI